MGRQLRMHYRAKASEYSKGLVKCAVVGHVEKVDGPRDAKPFGDKGQIRLVFVVGEEEPEAELALSPIHPGEHLEEEFVRHRKAAVREGMAHMRHVAGLIKAQGFDCNLVSYIPDRIREIFEENPNPTLAVVIGGSMRNETKTSDDYGRLGDLLQEEGILSAAQAALVRRTPFLIESAGRAGGASRSASPARG
jgi:hypothetical protein